MPKRERKHDHKANLDRAQRRYDKAEQALFQAVDTLANAMEDEHELVIDWTPGRSRMAPEFIAVRDAVDEIQQATHNLSVCRLIAAYYEEEDGG